MTDGPLEGGISNTGNVVRDGPHVLRPASPHTASIHAFLQSLSDAGFEGAPKPIGIDPDGRERLSFIEGDVALVPYPTWCQTDEALASTVRLMRAMHEASASFESAGRSWNTEFADPVAARTPGTVMCHNDVEFSNVVFRDGVAVAFIDFEFAAPGRSVHDLGQLARLCVPIDDDFDLERMGWGACNRPARLRLIADNYGLDKHGRQDFLALVEQAMNRIETLMRRKYEAADPDFAAAINSMGGIAKFDRRRTWWQQHRHEIVAALA